MIKTNKKIILVLTLAILLVLSSSCFAATVSSEKAKFEVVEENVCTINIKDTATFEKKMISHDIEKKEVDIQLKVTNTAVPIINKPTEIMFVIDNSLSMRNNNVSAGVTRMQAVTDAAKKLATSLLESNLIKIGVVSFSTGAVETEGTIADATLRTKPTNVKDNVLDAITAITTSELGARTNIDAGLTLANKNFSKNCESKYIVLLSDGVPNTALGGITFTYSNETATKTIKTLTDLTTTEKVKIFTVMTGVNSLEVEPQTGETYKTLAEEIFGTSQEPKFGKFYYISDSQIEKTITETVLENFKDPASTTLTNLKISDYFPKEIVDNFDFSYVKDATKGTISQKIDLKDNVITWTIDKLEAGQSASVVYKLKLKDTINESISNVVLDTNDKVEITAEELDKPLTSEDTPKVRVTLPKEEPKPEPKKEEPKPDNTVAPKTIPQTGNTSSFSIMMTFAIIICIVVGIRAYIINRDEK